MNYLGIDVGGSGIKGALVDIEKGEFVGERIRIPTPQPSTPKAVIKVITQIAKDFNYNGPIGVGFPAIVIHGTVLSAANVDDGWVNYPAQEALAQATGCPVKVMNDADVAGMAEMQFGAGRNEMGTVMIFTLGTGIGSVLFVDGQIVPNMELGHLYLRGQKKDAEFYAAERVRTQKNLKWKKWGARLNVYFQHIEFLFSPDLIILGGGVSKKHHKFLKYIDLRARVVPAQLRNQAGIVGAAVAASKQ